MKDNSEQKILIGIIAVIVIIIVIMPLLMVVVNSSKTIKTNDGLHTGGSSIESYSGGSSSGGSYKSKDPADYDSKGNYRPVETMTQEEKRQELIDILEDSLY